MLLLLFYNYNILYCPYGGCVLLHSHWTDVETEMDAPIDMLNVDDTLDDHMPQWTEDEAIAIGLIPSE